MKFFNGERNFACVSVDIGFGCVVVYERKRIGKVARVFVCSISYDFGVSHAKMVEE